MKAGCALDQAPTAIGISIERPTTGLQGKLWQPAGGELKFTVKSGVALPPDSIVVVCFRWKTNDATAKDYVQADIISVENVNGTDLTIGTAVPKSFRRMKPRKPGEVVEHTALVVPVAEARILVLKRPNPDAKTENPEVLADAITTIGVTSITDGIVTTLLSVLLTFVALWAIKAHRPKLIPNGNKPAKRINTFLGLIATPGGYASLSQLQVIIWTFVVAASAVYVMSLSGTLITISDGALVLLGISAASVITSKVKSDTDDKNQADRNAGTGRKIRQPRWSDLVVTEAPKDGIISREVDVTRLQMLYFTVIAAAFVMVSVLTNYVIPDIPTNFLLLMGISNGIYITAKYVSRT
jgi:hypothetical protein